MLAADMAFRLPTSTYLLGTPRHRVNGVIDPSDGGTATHGWETYTRGSVSLRLRLQVQGITE